MVGNAQSSSLSLLFGTGDGTFGPRNALSVATGPNGIVVADLNGDGIDDIATSTSTSKSLSVLMGIPDTDNLTFSRTFQVTVNPVNDTPTLDQPDNVTVDEDASEQTVNLSGITAGGGETQPLRVTATSSNTDLIADPTVVYPLLTDQGLVAHYSFDGNADDNSGAGHDTVVSGPVLTTDRFGNVDSAYLFDGVDDVIKQSNASLMPRGTSDFTVSLWINATTIAGDARVFFANEKLDQFQFAIGGFAQDELQMYLGGTLVTTGSLEWELDRWYQVGVTRLGNQVSIFRDGQTLVTATNNSANNVSNNESVLSFGSRKRIFGSPVDHPWHGKIDDIRIYDRHLAVTDIQDIYRQDTGTLQFTPLADQHGTSTITVTVEDPGPNGTLDDDLFGATTSFAVGSSPFSVSVADFDGDGVQDLAVANGSSNNVSILLGDGSGSFAVATNFATGDSPQSVSVGDFNGDGNQDLAVANGSSNNVSILLGTGSGSFGAATHFAVGTRPYFVSVGDFNGDGNPDLAVANIGGANVSILLGTGSGSFGVATHFAVGLLPDCVSVGDFNEDGNQDLAVANQGGGGLSILLGDGSGSFVAATASGVPNALSSVSVGDFNGDAHQDVAITIGDRGVDVLLGNGNGSFGAATSFATGSSPRHVSVGDFNGDGNQDLAVANQTSATVSILLGDGSGSFAAATNFAVGSSPFSVSVADFDADGNQDLAVANGSSNNVSILLGGGDNATTTRTFDVTVNPVNDVPTLGALSDLTIDEDASEQTVNLSGISAGGGETQPLRLSRQYQ